MHLWNLEQDTQDRITDIIRDANRSKEDIEQDFQRDSKTSYSTPSEAQGGSRERFEASHANAQLA